MPLYENVPLILLLNWQEQNIGGKAEIKAFRTFVVTESLYYFTSSLQYCGNGFGVSNVSYNRNRKGYDKKFKGEF